MSLFDQENPDRPSAQPRPPRRREPPPQPPPEPRQVLPPRQRRESRAERRARTRNLPRIPTTDEFIEVKPGPGPLRKLLGVLVVFGFVIGAAFGGAYWWYRRQVDPPGPPGARVSVVITKGSSTSHIGSVLEKAGVISNGTVFAFYVRRKHAGPFDAGRFVLRKHYDFDSVIRILERGPVPPKLTRVSIPEGLTLAEMIAKLHDGVARFHPADVRRALANGRVHSSLRQGSKGSWEGLLFPATYDVGARTELTTVLGDMAHKMQQVTLFEGIDARSAAVARKYGIKLSAYQALVVASLIQEEAGSAQEAPMIATVIYNRLQRGFPLGIDATSRWLAETTGKKIDFSSKSPYNTRRHPGLPPTPIAGPSEYAIRAALNPATGPWLYYVLTAPRKHTFVVTNKEFLAAKAICRAKALGCG